MKIIATVFVFCVLAFCGYGHNSNFKFEKVINPSDTVDTSRYVILKFVKEDSSLFKKSVRPATLSSKEIEKIENLISMAVAKHNKKFGKYSRVDNPSKYYKQFIAVINPEGEKEVWVNCRCSIKGEENDWRNDIIMTMDGGPCYFDLKVNLNKNTAFDLIVNTYD